MESKDVITELCERMDLLRLRYAILFRVENPATPPFVPMAEALARGLLSEDTNAIQITRTLVDPGELHRPDFWGTPLGRLLFLAGGYGQESCTQAVAAQVLSCSRQWVSAMVTEEKLGSTDDRGVFVDQVRMVVKHRADRLKVDRSVK